VILADVNVWVYAFRADSPFHEAARLRLQALRASQEPFLIVPSLVASFLRLVTNPKVFRQPAELAEAWEFVTTLQGDPGAAVVHADEMALGIFKHLSLVTYAAGNAVPDVFLAAIAVRHDATFLTADRDFGRFQALKCEFLAV
jgi:toxin-antitoxin system PIN domain toxin